MTETKKSEIKESGNYYRLAIALNIIKNKSVCRCDECGSPIKHPTGRNVCHIIGSGANKELYLDKRNNFILGKEKCLANVIVVGVLMKAVKNRKWKYILNTWK